MSAEATKLGVIITGATGMVGEGVVFECLKHPAVERVLVVNRRPYGAQHPKLNDALCRIFSSWTDLRAS